MAGNKNSGRRKVPTVLNMLHGNPSNRPPVDEPKGQGTLWAPPPDFDDDQREEWHYALEHTPAGLVTGTDRNILALWCIASVEHRRARTELRKHGQVIRNKDGNPMTNPFLNIMNRQTFIMVTLANQLGFSPSARASLAKPVGDGPLYLEARPDNDLDAYLSQKPDRLQ